MAESTLFLVKQYMAVTCRDQTNLRWSWPWYHVQTQTQSVFRTLAVFFWLHVTCHIKTKSAWQCHRPLPLFVLDDPSSSHHGAPASRRFMHLHQWFHHHHKPPRSYHLSPPSETHFMTDILSSSASNWFPFVLVVQEQCFHMLMLQLAASELLLLDEVCFIIAEAYAGLLAMIKELTMSQILASKLWVSCVGWANPLSNTQVINFVILCHHRIYSRPIC